jgi:hypothetical protein
MVTGAITRCCLVRRIVVGTPYRGRRSASLVNVPLLLRCDSRAGQHEHGKTSLSGNPNASIRVYPLARGGARREDVRQDP